MRIIVSNLTNQTNSPPEEETLRGTSRTVPGPNLEDEQKETEEGDLRAPTQKKKKKKKKISPSQSHISEKYEEHGDNSADERRISDPAGPRKKWTKEEIGQLLLDKESSFNRFSKELFDKTGFKIKPMAEDGNCLFRSVADQVYGDPEMHDLVREHCMNYMDKERDHYSQFITEDFTDYIKRKRRGKVYGNNTEIQAMGELYNRPVEIYTFRNALQLEPINLFHGQYSTDNPPIRLSYHNGNHYNSVIDPNNPSVGVGLGLPGLKPGFFGARITHLFQLADKMQVEEAMKDSEQGALEDMFFEETRKQSERDLAEQQLEAVAIEESQKEQEEEALQRQIEEAIIAESMREYYQQYGREKTKKKEE